MDVEIKKPTAFRLNQSLINRLKMEAKKENRSLNNYVEWILMNSVCNVPNEDTLEAIREAREGKSAGVIDTSSIEAFWKSVE